MAAPRSQPDDLFLRLLEPGSLLSKIVIARLNRFTFHNPPTHFGVEKGWRLLFNPIRDARGRGLLKYYRVFGGPSKSMTRFYTEVALQFGRPEVHTSHV